ncbi:MAG TPA: adenosylcobalamin-dependent ribonucleoside-diphosphate reductase [Spongiibacteraceae bacterium]|nr:adenosylcobalamin-dependent ribonucleoside-diphosphate reductase [Spongiibacteraceae bacterium]
MISIQNRWEVEPQPIARDVLLEKYAHGSEVNAHQIRERVATALAECERVDRRDYYRELFLDALENGFIPAGRINANAGTDLQATLLNCYVQPIGDSVAEFDADKPGIYVALSESAETLRRGGGVGYNFSALRPRGALVKSTEQRASGPLSYVEIFDRCCETIAAHGARRGAQLAVLNIEHPDIVEFINAKQQAGHLANFNMSVGVGDSFMEALHADRDVELVHRAAPGPEQITRGAHRRGDGLWVYGRMRASAIWDQIMRSTYAVAEPGVLFLDCINRENNLWYCEYIDATNPCGEQPLPPYGSCCLGSLNLTAFVREAFTRRASFNYVAFRQVIRVATRMLDNVIDITPWPVPAQQRRGLAARRIGLGITGLGDALLMLGLRYDSAAARTTAAIIAEVLRDTAYSTSSQLARERGAFPLFDAERYLQSAFIARLPAALRERIGRDGIRNSHLTSIAPAGTISLAFADNVSNGIEPAFGWRYQRAKRSEDGMRKNYIVEDYAYRRYHSGTVNSEPLPPEFVDAWHLDPLEQVRMVAAIAPYVDAGISKTVNIAADFPFVQFKSLYLHAWQSGLKGITTFRPNAVTGAVLSAPISCRQDLSQCDV